MRVLLIGPDHETNLSLAYLAGALRAAGHEPCCVAFNDAKDGAAVLAAAAWADWCGLSMCFQVRAHEFLDLARALKERYPGKPIVAGGHFASCAAHDLLRDCAALDVIALHEGERTIVDLANLGSGLLAGAAGVAGVVARHDGAVATGPGRHNEPDLDLIPLPDRTGPARLIAGVPTAYLMGSRGCLSACDYCCITTLHRLVPGKQFRQRSVANVAREMTSLYHERGVRQFVFHDDNFLVPSERHNLARIEALGDALGGAAVSDVGLVLKCRPRDAQRSVLTRLAGMGLLRIFMGVESGSQCGLDSIGRAQRVMDGERALELCEQLGISSQYTVITFHPEATTESMLADLDFVGRHPAHPVNFCRAEVYAGTPLERRLLAAGRLDGDYLARRYDYADPRVRRTWDLGYAMFRGRAWGPENLLDRMIRLDHKMAVLARFYRGAKAARLAREYCSWQAEANLETVGLLRRLVEACDRVGNAGDARLQREIERLTAEEREGRARMQAALCDYRARLDRIVASALPPDPTEAKPRRRAARSSAAPAHAAAVAVAIAFASAESRAQNEAVPVEPRPFRHDEAVAEAAPPPDWEYRKMVPVEPVLPRLMPEREPADGSSIDRKYGLFVLRWTSTPGVEIERLVKARWFRLRQYPNAEVLIPAEVNSQLFIVSRGRSERCKLVFHAAKEGAPTVSVSCSDGGARARTEQSSANSWRISVGEPPWEITIKYER